MFSQLAALSTQTQTSSKMLHAPGLLGQNKVVVLKYATNFLTPLPSRDGLYFFPLTWSGLCNGSKAK